MDDGADRPAGMSRRNHLTTTPDPCFCENYAHPGNVHVEVCDKVPSSAAVVPALSFAIMDRRSAGGARRDPALWHSIIVRSAEMMDKSGEFGESVIDLRSWMPA